MSAIGAELEALLAAAVRERDEARQRIAQCERQLADAKHHLAIKQAEVDAFAKVRALLGDASDKPTYHDVDRQTRQRRGRGMSTAWQACFSKLPLSPQPGMPVTDFYKVVRQERPNITEGAVRSALDTQRKNRLVEHDGHGWRLTRPLAAPVASRDEAPEPSQDTNASDTEASEGDAPEASDPTVPQPWFTADAAD